MTLQWTAVASFLYMEIGLIVFLCLPFISAARWQSIFKWSIWNRLSQFWNKGFLTMIIILIVLFLDALREVRKYSNTDQSKDAKLHPNMFDHMHMKLFRAQRNLYISGFSLFLWLVMRRVITLINQLATAMGTSTALQTQAESANKAAKKYMEDNEMLKQALTDGKDGGKTQDPEEHKLLKRLTEELKSSTDGERHPQALPDGKDGGQTQDPEEHKLLKRLTEELKSSTDALKKSTSDLDAMKKQTEGLTKEYDRLLREHQELLNRLDSGEKKDN